MHRFLWRTMVAAVALFTLSIGLEGQGPRELVAPDAVTILTDGIAEPNGRATLAVHELAERLGQLGKIRVLPIAGHGAAANVRDLLYLRGIDLAILNSDILAYLDQTGQYPDAKRRIRHVVHLFDQRVFLLVRKQFRTIEDLRGRKFVVLSQGGDSHATATTLFGLQNIDVVVEALGSERVLDDAGLGSYDGALLLSGELARLRVGASTRQEFHLLPILLTPALLRAYRSAAIEPQEMAGFAEAARVETVAVSTLLAVLDGNTSRRNSSVAAFIQAMFSALPGLRKQNSGSSWRQLDINAQIPGWTRYAAAEPSDVLEPAQLAELTAIAQPPPSPAVQPTELEAATIQKAKVRLLTTGPPPLADQRLPDGGLITALVSSSLSKAERNAIVEPEIEVRWTGSSLPPIQALLNDRSIDILLPWESADCERPNDLMRTSAVLCDNAIYSDPLLRVVIGLFTLSDSTFKFDTDESIFGKTICIPQDRDVSALNGNGRNWLAERRIAALRQPELIDCLSAVQRREADAFIANDLEGRYLLRHLGLAPQFKMAERPLGTRGVHAIVFRDHAQASELIDAVNRGLKQLKQSDAYATIVHQHLMRLWDARASIP